MAILRITGSTWAGPERDLILREAVVTLGREKDNGVVLDGNQISRHHAKLEQAPEGWVIEDLGSSNGSYVNGVRIARHVLKDGDVVGLGSVRMTFFSGLAPLAAPPPLPVLVAPLALPPPLPVAQPYPPPRPPAAPAPARAGSPLHWILGGCGLLLLAGLVAAIVLFPKLKERFAAQAKPAMATEPAAEDPVQASLALPAILWDGPSQDPQAERSLPAELSVPLPPASAAGFTAAGKLPVTASGGTFALDTFAPALRGSRLEIPQGAYPGGTTLRLSVRQDLSVRLDGRFTQVTPVLRLEGPSEPAAKPMRITFAAPCAADEFLLPCYVDLGSGQLHPMSRVAQANGKVTALVRHFCDTVVVKAKIVELENGGRRVETGFLPSVNGWPFDNEGSIANRLAGADRGNCEGMVLGASWSFRMARSHSLMRLADNLARSFRTPRLPQDDARGLYFTGRLQAACAPSGKGWDAYAQERLEAKPPEHWLAIRAGLLLTGQPQVVGVWETDAGGTLKAGHAVLAYAYSPAEGIVHIYDPNASGDDAKTLSYDLEGKTFKPYRSGKTKDDEGRLFNRIVFTCDEDWVPWPEIHRTGVEVFCDGRIPPNALPELAVEVREEGPNGTMGAGHPLSLEPRGPMPTVRVKTQRIALTVRAGRGGVEIHHREMVLDPGTGPTWVTDILIAANEPAWIDLKKGANILAVHIEGKTPADDRWLWSGWQWFAIIADDPSAAPKPAPRPKRDFSRRSY